jgi:hypothetical protein
MSRPRLMMTIMMTPISQALRTHGLSPMIQRYFRLRFLQLPPYLQPPRSQLQERLRHLLAVLLGLLVTAASFVKSLPFRMVL